MAVSLRYGSDLSVLDVATVLRISEHAAKQLLARAREPTLPLSSRVLSTRGSRSDSARTPWAAWAKGLGKPAVRLHHSIAFDEVNCCTRRRYQRKGISRFLWVAA